MISLHQSYDEVESNWIEQIPSHWTVLPTKRFHSVRKQINVDGQEDNVLSLTLRGVVNNNKEKPEGLTPASYNTYQIFEENNLVFKLIDLENFKTSRVGLVHENGIMSSAYIRLEVGQKFDVKYVYYYFFDMYLQGVYNNLGSGVRSTLGPKDLLEIPSLQPPYEEQKAIANFLDDKTEKIGRAIAIKEKQIELLKERKQILIQNAVTRGLNPDAPMKDSGVDWIGEIPAHWDIKRLRFLGFTQNGVSSDATYFGSGEPFISYSDVSKNIELPRTASGLANSNAEEQKKYSIETGDVFFTRTSETIEEIGLSSTCFVSISKGVFSGFLIRFRPRSPRLSAEFSKYYFSSQPLRRYFVREMTLVTRASLSQNLLGNLPVPLPPACEQESIFHYCEGLAAKIDLSISIQSKQIERLKEYKASLINSAVTGKVKVPA